MVEQDDSTKPDEEALPRTPFLTAEEARERAERARAALANIPREPEPEWDRQSPTAPTDPGAPIGYAEFLKWKKAQEQAGEVDDPVDDATQPAVPAQAEKRERPSVISEVTGEPITRELLMRELRQELGDEEFEKQRERFEREADMHL